MSSRRILILGRPKSGKLSLVKALTSTLPSGLTHEDTSHAGLTHSIALNTRYYSTEAGIWIDEIPVDTETWLNEYLSAEAVPVFQSLAAVILTLNPSSSEYNEDLELLRRLIERGEDLEWDGIGLVVGKENSSQSVSIANLCDEMAFEYIDISKSGDNEYGGTSPNITAKDVEKLGKARVLEVLHTCDWSSAPDDTDSLGSLQDGEIDFELNAFDEDEENKEKGSEKDVEYMERMMAMLLNARGIIHSESSLKVEIGQEMSLEERKRLARRTVETVAKMS